jgi:hypothetical protein
VERIDMPKMKVYQWVIHDGDDYYQNTPSKMLEEDVIHLDPGFDLFLDAKDRGTTGDEKE